jgi:hypothetical protein
VTSRHNKEKVEQEEEEEKEVLFMTLGKSSWSLSFPLYFLVKLRLFGQ